MFNFANESKLPRFSEISGFARALFVYASVARVKGPGPAKFLVSPPSPGFLAFSLRPSYSHSSVSVLAVFFKCPIRASVFRCIVSGVFYEGSNLHILSKGNYSVVCCPVQWVQCVKIDSCDVFCCVA